MIIEIAHFSQFSVKNESCDISDYCLGSLFQTEVSKQLLDGLLWNLIFMVAKEKSYWSPDYLERGGGMNKLNLHPVISAFPPSIRPSGKTLTICPPGGSLLGHVVFTQWLSSYDQAGVSLEFIVTTMRQVAVKSGLKWLNAIII